MDKAFSEASCRQHAHRDASEDADLLLAARDGCETCFEALFVRYWKLVYAIAWKILRQRSDAEDIVQDVFLILYLQSSKYDPSRGSVKAWIAQFAHFKALIRRRYIQTRGLKNLDELTEFESGLLRFGTSEGILERAAFVEECLGGLNPRQRRTVELVHFEGRTLLETAAVLNESLANTRNLYYRAMQTMRVKLGTPHGSLEEEADVTEKASNLRVKRLLLERACEP